MSVKQSNHQTCAHCFLLSDTDSEAVVSAAHLNFPTIFTINSWHTAILPMSLWLWCPFEWVDKTRNPLISCFCTLLFGYCFQPNASFSIQNAQTTIVVRLSVHFFHEYALDVAWRKKNWHKKLLWGLLHRKLIFFGPPTHRRIRRFWSNFAYRNKPTK